MLIGGRRMRRCHARSVDDGLLAGAVRETE